MQVPVISLLITFLMLGTLRAQVPEPCRSTRQACPMKNVKYCHQTVAYDDLNNIYLLRKDYATPFTGSCVSCYPSLTIEEKLNFIEGIRQGTDTSYYQTGCIQSIQTYQIGLSEGPTYVFYDSLNVLQFEIHYKAGQLHGPSIQYSPNGDTLMFKNYNNTKLDGPQRSYFSNGKVRKISHYLNGLLDGPQITYNNNGQKESELYFKNGKKNGTWSYYFDSGKLARTENWKDGKKNGLFISYNELGQIMSTEKYALDLPVDKHLTYYQDGKLNYSCTYSSKGVKVEEFVIDQYGVKKMLFPLNEPKQ